MFLKKNEEILKFLHKKANIVKANELRLELWLFRSERLLLPEF